MSGELHESEAYPLPKPPLPVAQPGHFHMFNMFGNCTPLQLSYMQAIYQKAYEQAQQAAQPSLLERDLLGVWN